ncbi:MAG: hypothetical protein LBV08_03000 [Clostridiales bacterium]|jgi:AraC-like DNA-binding protein|nr:hypothetical protein [Clostridiales bacterium]
MITIKDLSDELGKSKTSIYNLVKKNNLTTIKKEGTTFLTDESKIFIIDYYNLESEESFKNIEDEVKKAIDEEEYKGPDVELLILLKQQLEIKDKQLEEKEKTIQSLINVFGLEKQHQTMLLIDKNKEENVATVSNEIMPSVEKVPFFSKLFRRNKNFQNP